MSGDAATAEKYCPTCERSFHEGKRCPDDGTELVVLGAPIDPLIGRSLNDRYTIDVKLGAGGMGTVYRGTQHSVGREVAIKVVSPRLVSDPDAIKRFLREAKLASRLGHPNAVAILDFGQTPDGLFFLVMELLVGRTLDKLLRADGRFSPQRTVRIAAQICEALDGAHRLDIVHRDLKPANVMVLDSERDLVKVLDFGLAKSLSQDSGTTSMTGSGALLGTPAYMSPEAALGREVDARADLYSLGCMLYVLASGRMPFHAEHAHELISMQANVVPPPPPGVAPALAAVIMRLLEKDPALRYQSAVETRDAIEAALHAGRVALPAALDTTLPQGLPVLPSSALATTVDSSSVGVAPPRAEAAAVAAAAGAVAVDDAAATIARPISTSAVASRTDAAASASASRGGSPSTSASGGGSPSTSASDGGSPSRAAVSPDAARARATPRRGRSLAYALGGLVALGAIGVGVVLALREPPAPPAQRAGGIGDTAGDASVAVAADASVAVAADASVAVATDASVAVATDASMATSRDAAPATAPIDAGASVAGPSGKRPPRDRSGATSDRSGATTDRSGATSERSGATSDRSGATSDRSGAAPPATTPPSTTPPATTPPSTTPPATTPPSTTPPATTTPPPDAPPQDKTKTPW